MLLLKLSQTAYFDGLTLPDCRKWYGDSTGLNIIFIQAIGCPNMPGEGRPTDRPTDRRPTDRRPTDRPTDDRPTEDIESLYEKLQF